MSLFRPRTTTLAVLLIVATSTPATSAENRSGTRTPSLSLEGRHAITIHAGFLSRSQLETEVSVGALDATARTSGFLGSIAYEYWVARDWSIGVSAGVIQAEAAISVEAGNMTSEAATVVPLLFGAAYYPTRLAITPALRPYGSLAVGPYIGSATNVRLGSGVLGSAVSEVVPGVRAEIGMDAFLGEWFKTGIAFGYHAVRRFDEQIGRDRSYSGFELSMGLGILLGSGR